MNQQAMSLYSGINVPSSFYTTLLTAKSAAQAPPGTILPDTRAIISTQLYNLFLSDRNTYQIHLYVRAARQSNLLLKGFFSAVRIMPAMLRRGRPEGLTARISK
ncbi:hypothetical protein ACFSQ7_07115 [Paenibacillus rhizoplanae]